MNELLTTEQILNRIQNRPDCQDVTLLGGTLRRLYSLGCREEEVYGLDPDGNKFVMSRKEFLELYSDAKWERRIKWKPDYQKITNKAGCVWAFSFALSLFIGFVLVFLNPLLFNTPKFVFEIGNCAGFLLLSLSVLSFIVMQLSIIIGQIVEEVDENKSKPKGTPKQNSFGPKDRPVTPKPFSSSRRQ